LGTTEETTPADRQEEDLLRAQQWRDKLAASCWELYEHFHGSERYFKDHGLKDFTDSFDTTLDRWFSRSRLPSRPGLSFYAEVCGVHKSSMSRYLRCLVWRERIETTQPGNETETPDGSKEEPLSQNQLLRMYRWSQRGQFTAECVDRGLSDEDRVKELQSRKFKGEQDRRTGKAAREEDKIMPVLFVRTKGPDQQRDSVRVRKQDSQDSSLRPSSDSRPRPTR